MSSSIAVCKRAPLFLLVVWLASLTGCAWLSSLSYYDPVSYQHLTALKPKVAFLYDSFASDSLDLEHVHEVRLELAQAYEYERGKGEANVESALQVEQIQSMFQRHVRERLQQASWSEAYLGDKREHILAAFDLAIQTENLKNRRR